MTKKYIYLDHNATTKPRPEVVEAMLPHLRGHYGNASSIYQLGQEERKAVDIAREERAKGTKAHIGTTGRGIGPAYEMKARRIGVRVIDLFLVKFDWRRSEHQIPHTL